MPTGANDDATTVTLPFGAWHEEGERTFAFPRGWSVHRCDPAGAPAIDDDAIRRAFERPIGAPPLRELARGRRSAVVAVDDLTRPTPAHRILPVVLDELAAGGLAAERVLVVIGTAAHRPPDRREIEKKIGPAVARRARVHVHDFLGPDLVRVGWIAGGPVELDRHYLAAELRVCVGAVIPHGETGFGGGAKMVVPGLAGAATIAHFHGALPPRRAGELEGGGRRDRRAWAEEVARRVGLDTVVCGVINGRRELAGLHVGDLEQAHRAAAREARELGRTRVPRALAQAADVVVVSAYPLDTDPIQMGKSVSLAAKLAARCTVVVNAASDGIFYHGMGMGSGVQPGRLAANLPRWLASPRRQLTWLRSLATGLRSPELAARLSYFTLNPLSYAAFLAGEGRLALDAASAPAPRDGAEPLVYSQRFPSWGFRRRYPRGQLFRDWPALCEVLARRFPNGHALVFPCAPLQLVEVD
jgi:nickel-dependent lactate racemase